MPLQLYKIASNDLTTSVSSVTFSNIPQGYEDLKIVVSARDTSTSDAGGNYYTIAFNTGGTYSAKYLQGRGSTAASAALASLAGIADSNASTAFTFSNDEIYILNYRSSNQKSYSIDSVTENNATLAYATIVAGLWSGTAAITTVTLTPSSSASFLANSTFTLYGIL